MNRFDENQAFKMEVAQRLKLMNKRPKKKLNKKILKPLKWLHPLSLERLYQNKLSNIATDFNKTIRSILIPEIKLLVEENNSLKLDSIKAIRLDDIATKLAATMKLLTLKISNTAEVVEDEAFSTLNNVAAFNKSQLDKITRASLGVDIFKPEPWLVGELSVQAKANASLIKSLFEKGVTDVQGIVQRGLQSGARHETIAKEIRKKLPSIGKRAKFIARDQVSKLNGNLTKTRQRANDIDMYIWRTSADERVRETHSPLDGELCRWDDPTVFSDDEGKTWQSRSAISGVELHPGEDINCRCFAEPFLKRFVESLQI